MTTAIELVQDALEKIGVYSPGETISAADSARCLSILNDMLDSWSNESLTTYAILEQSVVLTIGQYQYTIGPGGNINATRPLRLIFGPGAAYLVDSSGNRYWIEVIPRDRWNLITNITNINSNIPEVLFYDPQFPLGIINVWPIPNVDYTLFFDSYLQFTEFAALNQDIGLPPGYTKAIKDSLAVEAFPYFKPDGATPSAVLIEVASKSKGNIMRTNIRENIALYDREILGRARGQYNIYQDGYNR